MAGQNVQIRLRTMRQSLTSKETEIADFICENMREASQMTISDMAARVGTAESTVFKFAKKLGYKGFRDFHNDLVSEQFDPAVTFHENISESSSPLEMASSVFESSIRSLADTRALLSEEEMGEAARMIIDAKTLYLFGLGGSGIVALDAYHKLMRAPVTARFVIDYHMQLMEASKATADDCAILFSHSGVNEQAIAIMQMLKKRGCGYIAITSNPASPIARNAGVTLLTVAEETSFRSESLSSRIAQLALVDSLYTIVMFSDNAAARQSLHLIREAIIPTREQA